MGGTCNGNEQCGIDELQLLKFHSKILVCPIIVYSRPITTVLVSLDDVLLFLRHEYSIIGILAFVAWGISLVPDLSVK